MKQISVTKEKLEQAFTKWNKDFAEDPDSFTEVNDEMQYDPKLQAKTIWDYLTE